MHPMRGSCWNTSVGQTGDLPWDEGSSLERVGRLLACDVHRDRRSILGSAADDLATGTDGMNARKPENVLGCAVAQLLHFVPSAPTHRC